MDNLDKISQVAIVTNHAQQILIIKNDILKLPEVDLGLGENPIVTLSHFLEQEFGIKVSDIKVAGVNVDRPGIVTLVYSCKLVNSTNNNLSWMPIQSAIESLNPIDTKILKEYGKNIIPN